MQYLIAIIVLLLTACGSPASRHHDFDAVTPGGIPVATQGNEVSLADVDRIAAEFETCSGYELPFTWVVIPREWHVSECSGTQLFTTEGCPYVDDGSQQCPTLCAGLTWLHQWGDDPHVVVTPDLAALAHEYIHVVTEDTSHDSPLFDGPCEALR